jgi:hypothetical protein
LILKKPRFSTVLPNDAVAETEETIEPPADDFKEYAESVRVCTNPHDKIQHPDKYPESPLDEYVWRDGKES